MDNITSFLDSFFDQIRFVKLDIDGLVLDHVAFQSSSAADYDSKMEEFKKLGTFINEEIIGGRRVAVFKLNDPIKYLDYSIPALELIEPRAGQVCDSVFQHAEFIVEQPFDEFIEMYPGIIWDTSSMHRNEFSHLKLNFENGMTLKFLHAPILELISKS